MIGSRVPGLLKTISRSPVNNQLLTNFQQVRHHGDTWYYRKPPPVAKWASRWSTGIAVLAYWWFYWNLYHDWSHLLGWYDGKGPMPNPRSWTDEELGIPPDDA